MNRRHTNAARKAYKLMGAIERDDKGNPTTLEGCVRSLILKNPDTIQWRDQALELLYCVLGTGIEWNRHGRLADVIPNGYMNMPPRAGGQGVWSLSYGREDDVVRMLKGATGKQKAALKRAIESIEEEDLEVLDQAADVVDDIDRRCVTYNNGVSWYPLSWYECRLCVPGKAQADFVDGAIQTAKLILATYVPGWTQEWLTQQKNKRYAKQMLRLLTARGV